MAAKELSKLTIFNSPNLQGYWKLEDLNDSSVNGYTLTNNNSCTFSTGLFNNGVNVASTGSKYLSRSNASGIANLITTGSHAISAWIYCTATPEGNIFAISNGGATTDDIYVSAGVAHMRRSGLTTNTDVTSGVTMGTNTWYHVCGTYDSVAQKLTIYINSSATSVTASGSGNALTSPNLNIGASGAGTNIFTGLIDDVSFFNRALSPDEVKEIYEGRQIGELWPQSNLVGLWHLSNTSDSSGSGYNLTNTNTISFNIGKFGLGADGGSGNTNKSLSTTNTLGIDGGACTIMGWFKVTGSTFPMILAQQTNNTSKTFNRFYLDSSSSVIFQRNKIGGASNDFTVSFTPGNNWCHYAYSYDGSTLIGYINGSRVGSVAASGSGSSTSTQGFVIGANESGGLVLQGISDEVAVFSRALSQKEISNYYSWSLGRFATII